MATIANSASNNHSPRNTADAALNSPQSRRAARGVSSPWTQILRGGESESTISASAAPSSPSSSSPAFDEQATSSSDWSASKVAASSSSPEDCAVEVQAESSDNGSGNSNAAKKPAWNKPSNGAVEIGPVMGAVSWPALSESTRASPKSTSSESLKALSDGSVSISQGSGIASSSSQKQIIPNNANPSLTANHVTPPGRQKFMRRGGGSSSGSVSANGGFLQPPPVSVVEMPSNNAGKSGSVLLDSSSRDHTHKETGHRGGFGSQSHSGNDHTQTQQRHSLRRGNGGPHPRGDGSYHHNYGGRRDQDRGNHDWNPHRNFNSRDAHMQPHRVVPRSYMRPSPHSSAPFIPPPPVPVRPYNPMGYPDMPPPLIYLHPPPESLRSVPIVAPIPPHPMFFPVPDTQLHAKIVTQIDYYFSNENLIKDAFLRQNMDDQGWVPIKLIAGFKKVAQLTDSIQLILEVVRTSTVVEVQGDKVRRRNDWKKWIIGPTVSSPQPLGRSSYDTLAANLQSVSLEEKNNKQGQAEAFPSRSSSGDLNSQSQPSSSEGTGQATFQAGSERSISARSSTK